MCRVQTILFKSRTLHWSNLLEVTDNFTFMILVVLEWFYVPPLVFFQRTAFMYPNNWKGCYLSQDCLLMGYDSYICKPHTDFSIKMIYDDFWHDWSTTIPNRLRLSSRCLYCHWLYISSLRTGKGDFPWLRWVPHTNAQFITKKYGQFYIIIIRCSFI